MTTRNVLQQALEALEQSQLVCRTHGIAYPTSCIVAIAAIKEELAKPAPEPVAWMYEWEDDCGNAGKFPSLDANYVPRDFYTNITASHPLYRAPPPPKVPEGWQLVPKEPSPEILNAAECYMDDGWFKATGIYKAMLAAAPSLPPSP